MSIPWREESVVIRLPVGSGDREQVYSGRLWQAVEWVCAQAQRDRLTIWLPERRVSPFCFDADQIRDLSLMNDRPRSGIGFRQDTGFVRARALG